MFRMAHRVIAGFVVGHVRDLQQPQRPRRSAHVGGQRLVCQHVAPATAMVTHAVAVRYTMLQVHHRSVHMAHPSAFVVSAAGRELEALGRESALCRAYVRLLPVEEKGNTVALAPIAH